MNKPPVKPVNSIWLGFAERRRTNRGTLRIHIRWGRVLVLMLILAAFGWVGKSVALYYFFRDYRDYEEVSLMDMFIFPLNRAEVRVRQGNYQIKEAQAAMEIGEYRRALTMAQAGVSRAPANLEGRMLLIQFYIAFQRPDLALKLLEDGLQYAEGDIEFIQLYAFLLLREKRDEELLELADRILGEDPEINDYNRIVALAAMNACASRGYYERARQYFEAFDLDSTMEGVRIVAQMLDRLGYRQQAIEMVAEFCRIYRQSNIDAGLALLADLYLKEGNHSKAIEVALDRSLRSPLDWPARTQLMRIYHAAGREDRLNTVAERLLNDFKENEAAMSVLGQFAADTNDVALARRVYENALENGFDLGIFGMSVIESHLEPGSYGEAVAFCNELARENPAWLQRYSAQFSAIRSLAYFGLRDAEMGNLYLSELKNDRAAPPALLIAVARKLRDMDRLSESQALLEEASLREENNELALAERIKTAIALGESRGLTQQVDALLNLRIPEFTLLNEIYTELNSDRFIFTDARERVLGEVAELIAARDRFDAKFEITPPTTAAAPAAG